MSPQDIQKFQAKLLSEKKNIESQLSEFAIKDNAKSYDFNTKRENLGFSPEDDALEEENFLRNIVIEQALEQRLKEIMEALAKIDNQTFGICERCHKPIEEAKLEVNPASDFCISCNKIVSKQQKNIKTQAEY